MKVKTLSRSGRQRDSGRPAHLRHVLGVQAPQDQTATPRVVPTKTIPPVIGTALWPRRHQHHHRVPIQPLRRDEQSQPRLPIHPMQILDHDHCRLRTTGMTEPVEQRQTSRERPVSSAHTHLPGHEKRLLRGVLFAPHTQHRGRRAHLSYDLPHQRGLSRPGLALDPNQTSDVAGGGSHSSPHHGQLGISTHEPLPGPATRSFSHQPTILSRTSHFVGQPWDPWFTNLCLHRHLQSCATELAQ